MHSLCTVATATQSAGSQLRNETLIPERGALHFRESPVEALFGAYRVGGRRSCLRCTDWARVDRRLNRAVRAVRSTACLSFTGCFLEVTK
jgi:hypothetical protein